MENIARVVSIFYEVEYYDLFKRSRLSSRVKARQMTIYLGRLYLKKSHKELADFFNLDHASSIHSIKTVINDIETSRDKRFEFHEIKRLLSRVMILDDSCINVYCDTYPMMFVKINTDEMRFQNLQRD